MTEPVPRSLHEHDFAHLEAKIDALERLLSQRIDDIDRRYTDLGVERNRAVDVALAAAKEKALAHNELIAQMKDQQNRFQTKDEASLQAQMLAGKVEALEKAHIAEQAKDKTIGMSAAVIMQLLVATGVIISIVVVIANWATS